MRSLIIILAVIGFIGVAVVTLAQDATPQPTIPFPTPGQSPEELATQVYENATSAALSAEDARSYAQDAQNQAQQRIETANNLLDLFQSVNQTFLAITGILLPALAVFAGWVGLNRLRQAQQELTEGRKRMEDELNQSKEQFEKQLKERQDELQKLRDELEKSAREQRDDLEKIAREQRDELEGSLTAQRDYSARANLALSILPLGERQYKAQDYKGAIDTYQRALELDPTSVLTHYRLGYVYTQAGNFDEAQKHLIRALEIDSNFVQATAALGFVYRRMAEKMPDGNERDLKFNEAEGLLLKATQISPKLIDDDGEAWWGSLGGLYRRRGQIKQAINAYEKAAEATPHSSYAFGNLALLYSQTKNITEMLNTYERVEQLAWGEVQGNIDNYWGYADLLTSRLALGKEDKAEEAIISVFRTAPAESPHIFDNLLDTLHQLKQTLRETTSADLQARAKLTQKFIDRIEAHAAEHRKNQTGELVLQSN